MFSSMVYIDNNLNRYVLVSDSFGNYVFYGRVDESDYVDGMFDDASQWPTWDGNLMNESYACGHLLFDHPMTCDEVDSELDALVASYR